MDPLTAIGLAGNIISFVDFSLKTISRAKQLYESAGGATAENEELESLVKNWKSLVDSTRPKHREILQNSHSGANSSRATALNNLSQQCAQVADELLEILDSVKVQGDGRTRKSAMQAMKMGWKQDRIDGLQRRLDRISKQLMDGTAGRDQQKAQ